MSEQSWSELLSTLVAGKDLSLSQSAWAMGEILSDNATSAQIAGFAVGLRAKGETVDELDGLVRTMYAHAQTIEVPGRVVDVVGTGGDRARTVNISTMAAVVIAASGVPVVKHGNRSASSASGAADVLEELGVRLDLAPHQVPTVAELVGITFCFAPVFHPSLRYAGPTRRELGIATVFNFLGPLTNPARPSAQAIGVANPVMAPVIAQAFGRRGVDALVFRGDDGLDEITPTTTTTMWDVTAGVEDVTEVSLDPRDLGFELCEPGALTGGDARHNASVFRRVLDGETGPVRDAVLMNAAAGLAAYEAAGDDLVERMRRNVERAREAIDAGHAQGLLQRWADVSASLAPHG